MSSERAIFHNLFHRVIISTMKSPIFDWIPHSSLLHINSKMNFYGNFYRKKMIGIIYIHYQMLHQFMGWFPVEVLSITRYTETLDSIFLFENHLLTLSRTKYHSLWMVLNRLKWAKQIGTFSIIYAIFDVTTWWKLLKGSYQSLLWATIICLSILVIGVWWCALMSWQLWRNNKCLR